MGQHRPKLDIEKVATGEHWYGVKALELNLVDEIKTSDELLVSAQTEYDIYLLEMEQKRNLSQKLLGGLVMVKARFIEALAGQHQDSRYH